MTNLDQLIDIYSMPNSGNRWELSLDYEKGTDALLSLFPEAL
jgi:hypothetical protein